MKTRKTLVCAACAASASLSVRAIAAVAGDQYILPILQTQGGSFTAIPNAGPNGETAYYHSGFAGDISRVYWKLTDPSIPTTPELYRIEWWDPGPAGFTNNQFQPIESQYDGLSEGFPIDHNIPWNGAFSTNHEYIAPNNDMGIGAWNSTGPGPHTPQGYAPAAGANGVYMWLTRGSELYVKWDFSFYTPSMPLQRVWSDLRLDEVSPLAGDANRDFSVNFSDALALIQHYGANPATWAEGDFNGDGTVNFSDVLLLIQHYGQSIPSGLAAATAQPEQGASAGVPEPTGLGLIGLGAALPLLRRRSPS